MAAIDNVKHLIKYTGGSNDAARRNTLIADGPLKMDAGHFFAVVLQRPANAGAADLSYREVEFIMGEAFDKIWKGLARYLVNWDESQDLS